MKRRTVTTLVWGEGNLHGGRTPHKLQISKLSIRSNGGKEFQMSLRYAFWKESPGSLTPLKDAESSQILREYITRFFCTREFVAETAKKGDVCIYKVSSVCDGSGTLTNLELMLPKGESFGDGATNALIKVLKVLGVMRVDINRVIWGMETTRVEEIFCDAGQGKAWTPYMQYWKYATHKTLVSEPDVS